jgi:hypothetical protein
MIDDKPLHRGIPERETGQTGPQVIHDTPGRLRLAVPHFAGSRARALACEQAVRGIPGVRRAQASPLTASLLVIYTPSSQTRAAIQECCAAWSGKASLDGRTSRCAHRYHRHAASRSLVVEVIRHILPLMFGSCPICRGK